MEIDRSLEAVPVVSEDGSLFALSFIFVKCDEPVSDSQLMSLLGIEGYEFDSDPRFSRHTSDLRWLHLAHDGAWAHIADDTWGTLRWSRRRVRKRVAKLAKAYDVFSCWVGDTDDSFGFEYYQDSALRRRCVVEDPYLNPSRLVVKESLGVPLSIEKEAIQGGDAVTAVMKIAASLGVETDYRRLTIQTYTKPR